jgi:hypothetical protein
MVRMLFHWLMEKYLEATTMVRELGVIAITASMAHLYLTVQNPIRYLST